MQGAQAKLRLPGGHFFYYFFCFVFFVFICKKKELPDKLPLSQNRSRSLREVAHVKYNR